MNLLSLNHDVLCAILSFIDSQSALQLSVVSRIAYAVGMPRALSSVTLSRSQRQLTIEPSAFGVSHHIEFQRTVDFSAAPELAHLLERARRLRYLSIACFEDLIAKEPRIGRALQAFSDLLEISLHNSAQLSLAVLDLIPSDLRRLAFTQLFNRKLPAFFDRLVKLTKLETLELAHIDLEGVGSDAEDVSYAETQQIPQIPSLRSLSVRGTTARMDIFVHAFPNIQSLQICGVYAKVDRDADAKTSRKSWSRLDHLRGNVPDFRYWNVICPVRRLDLDLTAYHYVDTLDVVKRSAPATKMDTEFWMSLVDAAPRVRYLELCLDEGRVANLHWWMVKTN
ncbi:hypothetical protein B0H21DRAFT_757099 [Amylocystis lapponica]|nr:hypothetical protein B0H21DRAFT_757099 [Amylocystis lapponica]